MSEEYYPIPQYRGYFATKSGKIYTARKGRLKEIGHSVDKDGYFKVMLVSDNGVRHHFRKHRVIAMTFLGFSDLQVNHKNGNRQDNRLENLEYVTERENQCHWRLGRGFGVGVCWGKKEKKWRAYFQQDHKWEHLGFFDKKEDAKKAYLLRLNQGKINNRYNGAENYQAI